MQAMMATAVRQTTTVAAAAISASGRPSRSAAVAARALAAASLSTAARDRSRSPSSSLSPVPPSPKDDYTEPVQGNGKTAEAEDDEVVEEKPAKKKRTRKPKEPVVHVIPDVERLQTTYKGRLGYACLNTILRKEKPPVFCSRTCRIDTILKEDKGMPYLKELGRQNTLDLIKLIEWNAAHHIYFLRVSSELFPFAAHPDYQYSLDYAQEELTKAGETARRLGVRLTSHPGQFSQLGSPRQIVIENTYRDLEYHNEVFDRMGMGKDSVMIIHGGGVFGDKAATLERFKQNYKELSQGVKNRLVLENDEICYNVDDLLPVCEELNIPLVFDFHHDSIFPSADPPEKLIPRILATWHRKGIRPKFHLSEPRKGAETIMERRAHADRCQRLPDALPDDIDLMIEAKDKEQAVFHLYRIYGLQPVIHEDLRPPAEEETKHTAGRKSNKKKKKAAASDEDGTDGVTASSPAPAEDADQPDQVVHAVEDGVAPPPEGKNAEGQAYSPPLDGKKVSELAGGQKPKKRKSKKVAQKAEDGAKAASPKKRKAKAVADGAEEDGAAEPPKAKKARTPKKKAAKEEGEAAAGEKT